MGGDHRLVCAEASTEAATNDLGQVVSLLLPTTTSTLVSLSREFGAPRPTLGRFSVRMMVEPYAHQCQEDHDDIASNGAAGSDPVRHRNGCSASTEMRAFTFTEIQRVAGGQIVEHWHILPAAPPS
jgi:hypothetical protein